MSQRTERRGIHVDQSMLLCNKGCGYYGNAAWQGLCSKCWREEYQRTRQKQIQEDRALAEKLQKEEEAAYASMQGASLAPFSKFEEKKTNEKTRKVTFFSPSSRTAPKKERVEQVMDEVEKYIMTCLYKSVFCPETTDDEKKDLATQNRIRALYWVDIQMLCVPVDEEIPAVSDNVVKAITDVIEMDSKRVPRDKLACITCCSKHIFSAIKITKSEPASADDFLPTLIYIVLKANPPRLQSNIQYITQDGYYFTNLCCAVAFIEKLDAQSLNLDLEDFERYMSGQASPRRPEVGSGWPQMDTAAAIPALAQVYQNLDLLSGLGSRQERVLEGVRSMQSDLITWQESVEREVQEILKKYPLESRPPALSAIDSDNVENDRLPLPLTPQVFAG
uniref:RAB guanine nucleotide exchange factor (GEF) 1 n=1 Tax=Hucho hucho TaxID=62062 RepID=A0A4W5RW96_9TELE